MRRVAILLGVLAALAAAALLLRVGYAPLPPEAALLNPDRNPPDRAYDVLGRAVSAAEAERLRGSEEGRRLLSPAAGAVAVDPDSVRLGREAFYRESYGNEVFLTDIMGMLDGGLSLWTVSRALVALAGRGTDDLQVALARDTAIGGRLYRKGETISTGLDVPRGGFVPLGIKIVYDRGRVRMGITCALCHATVNRASGKVVEGAPNANFNVGLMLALSSNSSAYFMHTSMPSLDPFRSDPRRTVRAQAGGTELLPEPDAFEAAVDAMLAAWPPGSFDSTPDLVNNPTSIPSSFTAHGHPYGWSGHAGIGPFRGLSALNNNVHALNSDTAAQYAAAPALFGMDPEVYLGTLLQRAPDQRFRYAPGSGRRPSELLAAADPNPYAPGVNSFAALPTYPRANYLTSNSLFAARPGEPVWHSIDAMSPYQNSLRPPAAAAPPDTVAGGRAVFGRAGCRACHDGPALSNNRVLPAGEIGTEPTRARAFAKTEPTLAPPQMFAPDVPTPPPPGARLLDVPMSEDDVAQARLAWAHGGSAGGYKVPNLIGLAWTAPYLHDGGVAAGADPGHVGVESTLRAGIPPDPANSLRALLDRELRARVVAANKQSAAAVVSHVTGEGHAFWVDAAAGFTPADRDALVAYLLSRDRPE